MNINEITRINTFKNESTESNILLNINDLKIMQSNIEKNEQKVESLFLKIDRNKVNQSKIKKDIFITKNFRIKNEKNKFRLELLVEKLGRLKLQNEKLTARLHKITEQNLKLSSIVSYEKTIKELNNAIQINRITQNEIRNGQSEKELNKYRSMEEKLINTRFKLECQNERLKEGLITSISIQKNTKKVVTFAQS